MSDYHGPFFRTGIDGSGKNWELYERISPTSRSKRLQLTRKQSTWKLQKPKRISLDEDFPNYFPNSELISPISEKDFLENISKSTEKKESDRPLSVPLKISESIETSYTGVFNPKEYIKDMMKEILKESSRPNTPNSVRFNLKKKNSSLKKVVSITEPEGKTGKLKSQNHFTILNEKSGKTKQVENRMKDQVSSESKSTLKSQIIFPRSNPTPSPYLTQRQEKLRDYECFRMMSFDPPKTPPLQTFESFISGGSSMDSLRVDKKKVGKKLSKKPKTKVTTSAFPTTFVPDPLYQSYPLDSRIQSFMIPQNEVYPIRLPPKSLKPTKPKRPVIEKQDGGLNSTLIVKKIPFVNGWFNDQMLPPTMPVEPKKKKNKKMVDAFSPMGKSNWSLPYQKQNDMMVDFVRALHEEDLEKRTVERKAGSVSLAPRIKKSVHPSKQFPIHIPGPKKENMYIGPYINSEFDFLRRDLKIKPKN